MPDFWLQVSAAAHAAYAETKKVVSRLGREGWRPFLGWGLSSGLIALVYAVAWRLFQGSLELTELVALAGAVMPLMHYIHNRTAEKRDPTISGSPVSPGFAAGLG